MTRLFKWLGLLVWLVLLSGCIANGTEAEYDSYKWQVAIIRKNNPDNLKGLACSGVALDREWVLTAAHCFYDGNKRLDDSNYKIVYGSNNLLSEDIRRSTFIEVYIGDGYNYGSLEADIALAKVYPPMVLDSFMRLPEIDFTRFKLNEPNVTVSGWGLTEKNIKSSYLRTVNVKRFDTEQCKRFYPGEIPQKVFCAGGSGMASCIFDSGGPIFLQSAPPIQLGIVIYGAKGCGDKAPGVYTDVWAYIPWIKEIRMKNK